ncbi:hypothetical protein [Eggerthia catenaformis]|uniref:hypothetical protein n=1 Tax=Eggerthia catenaformis TaxID=31973 RepID=UPI00248DCADA|nr:hypothetical protein [Eggerthia catenaformis]
MNELMDKLADKMLPVAQKMSDNRYLSVIRNAFVTVMPIVIIVQLHLIKKLICRGIQADYQEEKIHT